jgi:hypothetical protein
VAVLYPVGGLFELSATIITGFAFGSACNSVQWSMKKQGIASKGGNV